MLHEKRGGYANNAAAIYSLADKAEAEGVRILTGVTVTGFRFANGASSAIAAVETDQGDIACDQLVVGAGPWVRDFWSMLDLPKPSRSRARTARFTTTCRCGGSGSSKKACLASSPGS